MTSRGKEDKKVYRWKDFAEETSLHGVRFIALDSNSISLRVLWILLTLTCLGVIIWQSVEFGQTFIDKPLVSLTTTESRTELELPAVTVCLNNQFKKTHLNTTISQILSPIDFNPVNWSSPDFAAIEGWSRDQTRAYLKQAQYNTSEIITYCLLTGEVSGACELKTLTTEEGECYQINPSESALQTEPGPLGFMIFVTLHPYALASLFEGAVGAKILLHESIEYPRLRRNGFEVGSGREVNIIAKKKRVKEYPPYADKGKATCFDAENLENPLKLFSNYSKSACQAECRIQYMIENCGCLDPVSYMDGVPPCSFKEVHECLKPALAQYNYKEEMNCNCHHACTRIIYEYETYELSYPTRNFVRSFFPGGITEEELTLQLSYFRENSLLLHIYYRDFDVEIFEQKPQYDILSFIANVGGIAGLFLGASLLSIAELIQFLVLYCFFKLKTGQAKTNKISVKSAETNNVKF